MCEIDAGLTFIRHFGSLSSDFVPLLICARSFAFSLRRLAGLDHVALRPQKRGCLLRGGGGAEGEGVEARPRIPPEKERRDRGPPPEQWKC